MTSVKVIPTAHNPIYLFHTIESIMRSTACAIRRSDLGYKFFKSDT